SLTKCTPSLLFATFVVDNKTQYSIRAKGVDTNGEKLKTQRGCVCRLLRFSKKRRWLCTEKMQRTYERSHHVPSHQVLPKATGRDRDSTLGARLCTGRTDFSVHFSFLSPSKLTQPDQATTERERQRPKKCAIVNTHELSMPNDGLSPSNACQPYDALSSASGENRLRHFR
ncbi:unnamed protein product, partial [Ectocarpus sp. 13 AM-2016]